MIKSEYQFVSRRLKKRYAFSCCSMLLTLILCSCTTTDKQVEIDPFDSAVQTSGPILPGLKPARSVAKLSHPDNNFLQDKEGVVHAKATFPESSKLQNQVVSAHHNLNLSQNKQNNSFVSTADFSTDSKNPFVTPTTHTKTATNIRQVDAKRVDNSIVYASPDPESHPDEYLWDGGDRDYPVHFDRFNRLGLETEDTIAEYSDHTGKRHQKPTNRVAIYAPRFNVVRSMSLSVTGETIDKIAEAQAEKRMAGIDAEMVVANHNQKINPTNLRIRSRASGLEGKDNQTGMQQAVGLIQHEKLLNVFEEIAFLKTGQYEKTDRPILAKATLAASTWSKDLYPVIQGKVDGIGQLEARFQQSEFVGIDNSHLKKGRLRIVKLADKKVAKPGDVITFKIRYDNLGDLDLTDIKIIDNLTPRLEYIEDSATSDLDGQLVVEENGEGSLVLKFILEGALKGHKGGVITFQTKVR